jgi:hypothetical protein
MFSAEVFLAGMLSWPKMLSMIWCMIYSRSLPKVANLVFFKCTYRYLHVSQMNTKRQKHMCFNSQYFCIRQTLQDLLQSISKATVVSIDKAVSRICRLNHDLIPMHGCNWGEKHQYNPIQQLSFHGAASEEAHP